jgi:hypothetical protein
VCVKASPPRLLSVTHSPPLTPVLLLYDRRRQCLCLILFHSPPHVHLYACVSTLTHSHDDRDGVDGWWWLCLLLLAGNLSTTLHTHTRQRMHGGWWCGGGRRPKGHTDTHRHTQIKLCLPLMRVLIPPSCRMSGCGWLPWPPSPTHSTPPLPSIHTHAQQRTLYILLYMLGLSHAPHSHSHTHTHTPTNTQDNLL